MRATSWSFHCPMKWSCFRSGARLKRSWVISVNWFNEVDINNIGPMEAKGIKRGTNVVGGKDHPLMKQIDRKSVV